jgi:hypothetical protein
MVGQLQGYPNRATLAKVDELLARPLILDRLFVAGLDRLPAEVLGLGKVALQSRDLRLELGDPLALGHPGNSSR